MFLLEGVEECHFPNSDQKNLLCKTFSQNQSTVQYLTKKNPKQNKSTNKNPTSTRLIHRHNCQFNLKAFTISGFNKEKLLKANWKFSWTMSQNTLLKFNSVALKIIRESFNRNYHVPIAYINTCWLCKTSKFDMCRLF